MQIHEFELRYRAYKWLNHKFDLWWDPDIILEMTKISDQGVLTKPVQEIKPEELHEITLETYTGFKKQYIEANKEKIIGFWTLAEYIDRLEYELKVIKEMGFNSYFLIVADFVRWAKKNTIVVGPGRGSWAWSILAWVVRITDIDPLQFGLLFERFLNPARISMPDFDIDFEDVQREGHTICNGKIRTGSGKLHLNLYAAGKQSSIQGRSESAWRAIWEVQSDLMTYAG